MMTRTCSILTCTALLLATTGCSQGPGIPVHPAGGKVTLDDAPLAGAVVSFVPTGDTPGRTTPVVTQADGTYKLVSPDGQGVAAGKYRVTISRWLRPDGSPPLPDVPPMDSDARETLPPSYSDPDRTTLKAEVPPGGGTFDFSLKSAKRGR